MRPLCRGYVIIWEIPLRAVGAGPRTPCLCRAFHLPVKACPRNLRAMWARVASKRRRHKRWVVARPDAILIRFVVPSIVHRVYICSAIRKMRQPLPLHKSPNYYVMPNRSRLGSTCRSSAPPLPPLPPPPATRAARGRCRCSPSVRTAPGWLWPQVRACVLIIQGGLAPRACLPFGPAPLTDSTATDISTENPQTPTPHPSGSRQATSPSLCGTWPPAAQQRRGQPEARVRVREPVPVLVRVPERVAAPARWW